ncbi:MAG: hypothetical protein QOH61_768 [Chloroflexota bacterium]|jgi:hypothetical protein|nr:hypothetical protein [Chloroflexota bacterium]
MNDENESQSVEDRVVQRLRDMEERLAEMERGSRLRERARSRLDRIVPPEAVHHFRNAGREQLLGVRTLVDHWIGRLDEADARSTPAPRETIEVR